MSCIYSIFIVKESEYHWNYTEPEGTELLPPRVANSWARRSWLAVPFCPAGPAASALAARRTVPMADDLESRESWKRRLRARVNERPAKEPNVEGQEAQALQPDADVRTGRSRSRSVSRSRSRSRSPLAARTPGLRERRPFAGAAVNDWCRYVDQASGKPYWHSKARGYSTWVSQETVVEPTADAAPAGAAARHPQQVNNGNPYQRISATLTAFEKQLAEERARLPAGSYYQYYQSLAAPATTQGYVQQQPLWNPTLLRWQQELDEQARALGARFP